MSIFASFSYQWLCTYPCYEKESKGYLNYVHNNCNINTVSSVKNIMYSIRSAQILVKLSWLSHLSCKRHSPLKHLHLYDKVTVHVFQIIRDVIKQLLTNIALDNLSKAGSFFKAYVARTYLTCDKAIKKKIA